MLVKVMELACLQRNFRERPCHAPLDSVVPPGWYLLDAAGSDRASLPNATMQIRIAP